MSAPPGPSDGLGVAVVHWPAEASLLDELASGGVPRLVVVDPSTQPPTSDDCSQDWVWQHTPRREQQFRIRQLARRARSHNTLRPHLDDYGILIFGEASVPLADKERRLAGVLIDRFDQPVARAELGIAAWRETDPSHSKLASRLSGLRRRIQPLGLDIQRTPSGYRMTRR